MQRSYDLGGKRVKPKKDVDFTKFSVPEIPVIAHAPWRLNEVLPILFDKFNGKHTRPALCSLEEAKSLVETATKDFPRRPEITGANTIPRACAYVLGATVQLMKSCNIPRDEIKELVKVFREAKYNSVSESRGKIKEIISKNTASMELDVDLDHSQLRRVSQCGIDLMTLGHKKNRLTHSEEGLILGRCLESLKEITANFRI